MLPHPRAKIVNELVLRAARIQAETHLFRKLQQICQRGVLQVVDGDLLWKRWLCAIRLLGLGRRLT